MTEFFDLIPLHVIIIYLVVIFMAGVLRGTFGFGDGLFVIPVMMSFLDVNTIIAIMVWFELVMIFYLVGFQYKEIDFSLQIGLLKWAILGIPLGLLFLKWTPEYWLKLGFGPVVLMFALTGLTPLGSKVRINDLSEAFFGFLAGVLAGAYNASGPPMVTYISRFQFSPKKFVINLQAHFLVSTLFLLVGHFFNGFWSRKVFFFIALGLPVLLLALYTGQKLRGVIHPEQYSSLIFKLLLLIALISLGRIFLE
jgi:uncharacterized membrane protein YfcA